MVLFLLFLVPIGVALIIVNFNREGEKIVLPLLPFFWGLLLFIPSVLLLTIVNGLFEPSYTAGGLFLQTLVRDHFLLLACAIGWAVLLRHHLFQPVKKSSLYKAMAFFGGYYTAVNVNAYLDRMAHLDLYTLFLLPILALATVVVSSLLLVQAASFFGVSKYLSLSGLAVMPVASTVVTVLFIRNLPVLSVVGCVVVAGLGGALFYLQKEKIY